MSLNIDRALMSMSLEDKDEPFILPNLPEVFSTTRNALSIVGRVLNPDSQRVSNIILDMPRKWRLYDKVHGLALSNEKFQFFFRHKEDMEEVLRLGVHTYNDWTLVIDRWQEKPPPHYLQFLLVWVRIRNIPINHYTEAAITKFGEILGEVIDVDFDPDKPHRQDFVKVKILFDVTKPVRKSKRILLPRGGDTTLFFEFERIQKKCFFCLRLSHTQEKCPFQVLHTARSQSLEQDKDQNSPPQIISENDPLFGILSEDQVGINPDTGKERIDPSVLDGFRQYIIAAEGDERVGRQEKIRASLKELSNDPLAAKALLSLESDLIPSDAKNKRKGKDKIHSSVAKETSHAEHKLMSDDSKANTDDRTSSNPNTIATKNTETQSASLVQTEPEEAPASSTQADDQTNIAEVEQPVSMDLKLADKTPSRFKRFQTQRSTSLQEPTAFIPHSKKRTFDDPQLQDNSIKKHKQETTPDQGLSGI